jgi:hypothetical protein
MNATKVPLGQVVMTAGVATQIARAEARRGDGVAYGAAVAEALARHEGGDWGEVCAEDKASNDDAVKFDGIPGKEDERQRVLSAYTIWQDKTGTHGTPEGTKVWIITEWDRSVTTVLFPDEY